MKNIFTLTCLLAVSSLLFIGCKKSNVQNGTKESLILGKWNVSKIELNIYSNTTLLKDSVLPWKPLPSNYVIFNADGTLEYMYNTPTVETGKYEFVGADSIHATIGGNSYKWQNLLLTTQIFNVVTTQPYAPVPGTTVNMFHTFTR